MINHIVLFKFKESLSLQDIDHLFTQIRKLSEFFPGIQNFSWGPNNSSYGLNRGFEYALFLQFDSEETRKQYGAHPLNEEISEKIVRPALENGLESSLVVDFETV
ncbi:MAG: hypothetical protein A2977_00305 [Alphaproteobacteria bacterium RIFCSPLOWO2_01_FULL_45_8]|nr:MAG: hypothetical protein A2065_04260 [Alphaproteobacteria bacterium GWB1_45_5]OFW76779.1 MAG: hypothetical protein A3K20_01250 [Alphaproteobacteria bacterium GWA1_45_9]OFW89861.1 MAG: hypothetical protein A2621_03135 [Alphaproteobacteria bacterium RIFCSPHIGHO2_01_FULL_41_14]OFW96325.1 MAG: hypothetical protein A2977_00305 [Alphaproteobacteria bacterium RIFCSPLOWO2_01_FULL_45_8]HCI48996.1 hypothetical protein [Holosporales bacterium]